MSRNHERRPPDGVGDQHAQPIAGWRHHASPLSLVAFGSVIVLGLSGVLGHERDWRAEANGVALEVHAPETTRNGEFFEMRIDVRSERRIGELVIGMEAALWEDMTVNTMIPAPAEEESSDGQFRFVFAALEPETTFHYKLDLQVNPDIVGGNEGTIAVYDGEQMLADTRISIMVLP